MKREIKVLYRKNPELARQVAKVLGYKIKVKAKSSKVNIDDIVTYTGRAIFSLLNKLANKYGYVFKMSANEFEKYYKDLLASGLK